MASCRFGIKRCCFSADDRVYCLYGTKRGAHGKETEKC